MMRLCGVTAVLPSLGSGGHQGRGAQGDKSAQLIILFYCNRGWLPSENG